MSTTTTFQPSGLTQGLDLGLNTFASSTPTADGTTTLAVGRSGSADKYRAVVDMDLTGARCGVAGIPPTAVIVSATLTVYCTSEASSAYACLIAPIEPDVTVVVGTTTWLTQDASRSWETAGGDYDSVQGVAFVAPIATGAHAITGLASIVQNAIDNGISHIGFLIRKTDETSGTSTWSFGRCNQAYAATSRAPSLVVVWRDYASRNATPDDPPASATTIAAMTGTTFFSPSRVGTSVRVESAHPAEP